MSKNLVKTYGEISYATKVLNVNIELLNNSLGNISTVTALENISGLKCLIDLLSESIDSSADDLTSTQLDNIGFELDETAKRLSTIENSL